MVSSCPQRIVSLLKSRQEYYMAAMHRALAANPNPVVTKYDNANLHQFTHALLMILEESALQQGDEARTLFLTTAIPGGIKNRGHVAPILHTVAAWLVLVVGDVVEHLPAEDRREAFEWFSREAGTLVEDVARAGFSAMVER